MEEEWILLNETKENDDLIIESDRYYHKNICGVTCPYRPYPPSKLLDFGKYPVLNSPISIKEPIWCLNSPNRLTTLIRDRENDVSFVSEGLIKTGSKEMLQRAWKRTCENLFKNDKICDLKMSDVDKQSPLNVRIVDFAYFNEPDMEISPLVRFAFVTYISGDKKVDEKNVKKIVDKMTDDLYVCGYNFSHVGKNIETIHPNNGRKIALYLIQFEAKFSDYDFNLANELFHVTPSRFIEKIKDNGLVPSGKSPLFKYPKRVYLFNFRNNHMWNNREFTMKYYMEQRTTAVIKKEEDAKRQFNPKLDKGFYVLKIRRDNLENHPLYKNGKMEFYIDSCYDGMIRKTCDSPAIFTYGNIPREIIEDNALYYPLVLSKKSFRIGNGRKVNIR